MKRNFLKNVKNVSFRRLLFKDVKNKKALLEINNKWKLPIKMTYTLREQFGKRDLSSGNNTSYETHVNFYYQWKRKEDGLGSPLKRTEEWYYLTTLRTSLWGVLTRGGFFWDTEGESVIKCESEDIKQF